MDGVPLWRLLERGDAVAVTNGNLKIKPASGREVPSDWLKKNERRLITEAAQHMGYLALEYLSYSTGNYGTHCAGGVTLQFRCLGSGKEPYAIFNVKTNRSRTTKSGKAGAPLPKGHFSVGERSRFFRFWKSTGLPFHRLSDFHDYMGNLGGLIYTGSISEGERLDAKTLRPLTLILPDKYPTPSRQAPDTTPTREPDKEFPQHQNWCGFQPFQSTGQKKHGNTVIRERGYTESITSPEDQTNDEWLADYESAPGLPFHPHQ